MLWAVTSYFNPCGYRNRLRNYRLFRERLQVPLVTAELSFDDRSELQDGDADELLRFHDGDIMFQKERLLNLAMQRLPPSCTAVAWLDCDVVFEDDDWGRQSLDLLETVEVIQPFGTLYRLTADSPVDFDRSRETIEPMYSLAGQWIDGKIDAGLWASTDASKLKFRGGIAWAARRELLERVPLYDGCIIGGGDKVFSSELLGVSDPILECLAMSDGYSAHVSQWQSRFRELGPLRFGSLSGSVMQLWHGDYALRRYQQRHAEFARFDYDPLRDLQRGPQGTWQWTDPDSEMATYVKNYFFSRREDG